MRTSTRRLVAAWWFVVVLAASAAADAAPATFAFTVSTPDPASHQYHVRLRCDGLPGETAEFRMPVWTPGYYGVFDYAGNVRSFAATDSGGRPLAFSKSGPNAWVVQKGPAKTVVLSYDVAATSSFVANAFLDETRGYITPGALFVYVPGQLRRPVTVTIELHPKWSSVATGLEPVPNGSPHRYRAADFDVLYDSPILMGNLEALPAFQIKGIPHRFVGYALGEFDRRQFVDDLRAVVEAGTQIIGDIPYKHYTFLGIGPGRGGIEHANSTAVPFSGIGADRASRSRTLAFLAHEYFHHYNVKRIRPIALGPFDYDRPNVTDMLWVSEGFTSYYEYLMLVRSGRMTPQELLDALTRTIAAVENNPGRLFQSATASSRDTWTQGPFGRGSSGVRRTISYYDKGLVLGLLLDFRIRHDTQNRKSLDTAMRTLYQRYYKKLGRGWTDAEFRRVCEETAGTGLADFFEYASTTRTIDYERYLAYAGLQLEPARSLPDADLGALVEDVNGALTVAAVEDASAAAKAGILAGDVVAAVDGRPADAAGLKTAVAARKSGDRLQVLIRRGGAERVVDVVLDARMERSWRLMPAPQPSAQQAAIFANWTAVTVK
jgi:predicted metalloprotease with PDZ domain